MRQYQKKETNVVDKIVCNKCGKEIIVENGIMKEDVFSAEKRWGYFSEKDNELHRFDLCEACYDEVIESFLIPIEKE